MKTGKINEASGKSSWDLRDANSKNRKQKIKMSTRAHLQEVMKTSETIARKRWELRLSHLSYIESGPYLGHRQSLLRASKIRATKVNRISPRRISDVGICDTVHDPTLKV